MARIKIEFPEKYLFETEIIVRISDINYGGHLGNDAVLAIAHEARLRFLSSMGYSEMNIENAAIIMTDAAIVYRNESFYGDVLKIALAIQDITNIGFDILYKLIRTVDNKEIARVKTGIAFFDYESKKIIAIPVVFKAKILLAE